MSLAQIAENLASVPRPSLVMTDAPGAPLRGCELLSYSGTETLAGPTSFQLHARASAAATPPLAGKLLNFGCSTSLHCGAVTCVGQSGENLRVFVGNCLEGLGTRTASHTWVGKTLPAILVDILNAHNLECDTSTLIGTYATRPFTLQYRETDLAFVWRRMEQAGLFVVYGPAGRIVLRDSSLLPLPGTAAVPLTRDRVPGRHVTAWENVTTLCPAGVATRAVNPEQMSATWSSRYGAPDGSAPARPAVFEAATRAEADARAQALWQVLSCYRNFATGSSDAPIAPGMHFTFEGRTFFVVSVSHAASQIEGYRNTFVAIPADSPFRPARLTPRPVVGASLKAVVLGVDNTPQPANSIAHADERGRVAIRFAWDEPDAAPAWAPVAPGGFSTLELPRAGTSVEVEFRDDDGDLDCPVVVRRVPWDSAELPHKTKEHPARVTTALASSRPGAGGETRFALAIEQDADRPSVDLQAPGQIRAKVAGPIHLKLEHDLRFKLGNAISFLLARAGKVILKLAILAVESETNITLKVRNSVIVIGPQSIALKSPMIYINSDGGPDAAATDDDSNPGEPSI